MNKTNLPAEGELVAKKLNTIPIDISLLCCGEFHF
jgi:hypothetical protein